MPATKAALSHIIVRSAASSGSGLARRVPDAVESAPQERGEDHEDQREPPQDAALLGPLRHRRAQESAHHCMYQSQTETAYDPPIHVTQRNQQDSALVS